MRYDHVLRAVRETPWAVRLETLGVIQEVIGRRVTGDALSESEIVARLDAAAPRRDGTVSSVGSVAVLSLFGVMMPRASLMTQMSGGASTEAFAQELQGLIEDDTVDTILLNIDSPGGMTDLVPETAALIRSGRDRKPIVAIANTDAASAAYWLASQATELVVTPSGSVGSIGVYAAHQDVSQKLERDGIRTTLISAGRYKVEGNAFEPLSEEARAALQAKVDTFYGMFVADVAAGRGVTTDAVTAGFGEGRMVTADAAVTAGMADRVATLDETLARLTGQPPRTRGRRRMALADDGQTVAGTPAEAMTVTIMDQPGMEREQARAVATALVTEFTPGGGVAFATEATELAERARHLTTRATSLAEVQRGRLTAAKREHLAACSAELRASLDALTGLLEDTDHEKRSAAAALAHERLRHERRRANL